MLLHCYLELGNTQTIDILKYGSQKYRDKRRLVKIADLFRMS